VLEGARGCSRVLEGARGCSRVLEGARCSASSLHSPSTSSPNTTCLLLRWGKGARVMKNWLELVLRPELAMDRRPGRSANTCRTSTSINPRVLQTPHLLESLHTASMTRTVCQGKGFVVKRATVNGHACKTQRNKDPRRTRLRRAPFDSTSTPVSQVITPVSRLIMKAVDGTGILPPVPSPPVEG
jgi:hypothetical protein